MAWNFNNTGEKLGELAQAGCLGLLVIIVLLALLAWATGDTPF